MADPVALAPDNRQRSVWRNVSFMLMWSSVAASGFGDRLIQLAAEPMLGVHEPGASAAKIQAGIMYCFFLPYMLLTLVGGWLADKLPRKWIMLCCDQGRAGVLLIAFLMLPTGTVVTIPQDHVWFTFGSWTAYSVAKVYLVIAATGCFAAIFNPARNSTVPQIVPVHHLQTANAVIAGIALIASLLGVAAGGPIIEQWSVRGGVMIGCLAFAISGWFFAFLNPRYRSTAVRRREPLSVQLVGAVRYLTRHGAVRGLVLFNVLFWAAAYVVNAAIAALVRTHYGLPVANYLSYKTTMLALLGVGMLLGSFYVMWLRTRRESGPVTMAALVGAALAMFLLAIVHVYALGLVLALLAGFFGGVALICIDTLTQALTPDHLRGRVFGLRALLNTTSGVVVNLAIWRLPERTADQWMIPLLAALAALLLLIAATAFVILLTRGPMPSRLVNCFWHLCRGYALVWHRVRWIGKENIPHHGPVILAANHTTGLDPFLMQSASSRLVRWVMLTEYQFRMLRPLWDAIQPIALEKSSSDLTRIRAVIRTLERGEVVGLFPEGALQRDRRELQPFQPGVGMIAQRSGATIVPVWIEGTPKKKHMFWHFVCPSRSTVTFGKPYKPDPGATHEQVVEELRERMLGLGERVTGDGHTVTSDE